MTTLTSARWGLAMTARSSIAHGGDTHGTVRLLRRETVVQPDGTPLEVPIVSGNSLRGRLRRISEELLRDQLRYEGKLSPAAAHALRGGGALVKTSKEALSGSRLAQLRALIPHVGVFGMAGGGAIVDGALTVGKVVPVFTETEHITGQAARTSAFAAVQLESYTRVDDTDVHEFADVLPAAALHLDESGAPRPEPAARQMLFQVETLPAGTRFIGWVQLRRPTELELSLVTDILATFSIRGTLGGRLGIGHGEVIVDVDPGEGSPVGDAQLWREHASSHRAEILAALEQLT